MFLKDSKKVTWAICIISWLFGIVMLFFLPNKIPSHFTNGVIDSYSGRIGIFFTPLLQTIIIFLSSREKIRYFLTHSKTPMSDVQFNWMVSGLSLFLFLGEIMIADASFS